MQDQEIRLPAGEAGLRDHIANLLNRDGHSTQTEVRLPERFRVDVWAEKEGVVRVIEVKKESRGIPDDIIKCQKLLQLPEITEAYVAAPDLLISPDHVAFASSIGVGMIGVTDSELKWLVQSWRLEEARLSGSRSHPSSVIAGQVFEIKINVTNHGKKIARYLEARCLPAGPFVFAPSSRRKYTCSSLYSDNSWAIEFLIRVRPRTVPGVYPLFTTVSSQNAKASESTVNIKVDTVAPDG